MLWALVGADIGMALLLAYWWWRDRRPVRWAEMPPLTCAALSRRLRENVK